MRPMPDQPAANESARIRNQGSGFFNVPNVLTCLRVLLIPFFVAMMVQRKAFEALLIILVAGATDVLDGLAARATRQKTRVGAFLDPAADKLMMTACFIVLALPKLSTPNCIPLWLTVVVIGRDVVIALGTLVLIWLKRVRRVSPTILGKTSTVCQVGTVWAVVLFNYLQLAPGLMNWAYYLTLVVTGLSGIQYVFIGVRSLKSKNTGNSKG